MSGVTGTPSVRCPVAGPETLTELEFGKALELVAARAVSPLGADAVRRRRPSTSGDWIERELATVAELASLLADGEGFYPEPIPDLTATSRTLAAEGAVLTPEALSDLMGALATMRRVLEAITRLGTRAPRVGALAVEIPSPELHRDLSKALEPDGAIKDDASSEVRHARKRMREVRSRLVETLQRMTRELGAPDEGSVTLRNGRYVIPVRRDIRSRVQGLVHDESSSGATLFVEPVATVELGNELRSAEVEEARAVHALLRRLTEQARSEASRIVAGWEMCVQADALYARSRYMADVEGAPPTLAPAPAPLAICQGYHPLIREESSKAVAFDLHMAVDQRTLLVSGPNAGGKTVLLKAVALINALAQSGIVPPVGRGTSLPIFRRIFADIGDHQSIAESLSTFSAHVSSLDHILRGADEGSLVLLDELGAGTDPFEGAALAGAVLLALTARGALTIGTTHLSQLKDLAAAREGFVNASLQFDGETLTPTYRFLPGQPGRSYGLAIARRLGFPTDVLATAEELVPESVRSLEAALAQLEGVEADVRQREAAVAAAEVRIAASRAAVHQEGVDLAERTERLHARERELEREGREQARRFLLEARRRVEEALGVARAAVGEATAKEARRLVEDGVRDEAEALKKLEGRGWRLKNKDEQRADEVGPARRPPSTRITPRGGPTVPDVTLEPATAASEIDLRGMTAEEAEAAVLVALDAAVVADLPWLRIIHGKGTGVLRATVAQLVKRDRRVSGFRLAPPNQGGSGVTIVEFGP